MKNKTNFEKYLKGQLKDPVIKDLFESEEIYANLAIQIARERKKMGISQKELAKLVKTSQQAISRLESSSYRGYSIKSLQKIANVFG